MPDVSGGSNALIFDPRTFAFLGVRDVLDREGGPILFSGTARLRVEIVEMGQLPPPR
jgi:hypothetical protein